MFFKKLAAFLTGAAVLALALPVLAVSQASETTADAAPAAAQEAAEAEVPDKPRAARGVETQEPDEPRAAQDGGAREPDEPHATQDGDVREPEAAQDHEAEGADAAAPGNAPLVQRPEAGSFALYMDGKALTDGAALLSWSDPSGAAPTAVLKAVGADGSVVSPVYDSSDDGVVYVDESGFVTAVGCGVATITATLDAQKARVQVSVAREVRRMVIIGEAAVSHGRSIKLRAFDQDGNRIRAIWRTSSEELASISADGVLTVKRGASGQSVDVTAFADERLAVFAVKNIRID